MDMSWRFWVLVGTAALLSLFAQISRADTVSCDGKRGWQRQIVRDSVHGWFQGEPRPEGLISLIQAEHGIVACGSLSGHTPRLHTPTLPRGLELDQLGAVLLANELEWSGLVPRPEEGLAGKFFRVRLRPARFGEDAVPEAMR
jgi:hypothetical protein